MRFSGALPTFLESVAGIPRITVVTSSMRPLIVPVLPSIISGAVPTIVPSLLSLVFAPDPICSIPSSLLTTIISSVIAPCAVVSSISLPPLVSDADRINASRLWSKSDSEYWSHALTSSSRLVFKALMSSIRKPRSRLRSLGL